MSDSATYANMMLNQSAANNAFNASQAQINRDWQEYMSGTSHQREVLDLQAAGLNPILSVNSGASVGSGAQASADTSSASGLANLAVTFMNNLTAIEQSNISARAVEAAASIASDATKYASTLSSSASKYSAALNALSSAYTTPSSLFANSAAQAAGGETALMSAVRKILD